MYAAQSSAALTSAQCSVCLLFLRSLSGQRTKCRNTLADTVSQHCYSGDESAVLNRIAHPPPSIFGTVRRHTQGLWILIVYQTAKLKLTVPWMEPRTHSYIWTVSTESHQHHIPRAKLTPTAFPRNEGVLWTPLQLVLYWSFGKRWI